MSEQRKKFYIARIDDETPTPKQDEPKSTKYERERYISSISGYNVKDTIDYPYVKYGNGGYQYQGLKEKHERSAEYINDMNRLDSEKTNSTNRIPSYLMREDYNSNKKNIASYPANERTFIEAQPKPVTVEQPVEKAPEVTFEQPQKEAEIDYFNDEDNNLPKSQLVRTPRQVDDNPKVSFEETKSFFANREREITQRKIDEDRNQVRYEESFTTQSKNVQRPSSPIPETRPVYSTPDNPMDIDPFDDIELELFQDNTQPKEQLDSYQRSVEAKQSQTVHEVVDTRGSEKVLKSKKKIKYFPPKLDYLNMNPAVKHNDNTGVQNQRKVIDDTLVEFGIGGHVTNFDKGPTVTRFEVKLDPGVKIDKIRGIQKNLQMNLESRTFRMQAPIPGKATIGIEVPNRQTDVVYFGELLANKEFMNDGNPLNVVLGSDVTGQPTYLDISTMPHGLIAGTSGSGKSVCINSIIMSILYKASPDEVKLILVDPKLIEFTNYEDIPHLATPVISDPKLAAEALSWAVDEMQRRYELFKSCKCRDFGSYNEYCKEHSELSPIPYVVIIIDELNDLMMSSAKTVEESITRLAQKARAAGIHLILATQRPTTDVISGTIKANIAVRIAFAVAQANDSRTILDHNGAETLLGKGDMLYFDGVTEQRVQGAYVSTSEIVKVTDDIKSRYSPDYMFTRDELKKRAEQSENESSEDVRYDEFFEPVARWIVENNSASINRIQKTFNFGFNRAQAIVNELEKMGVVSESLGTKQRQVLVSIDELEDLLNSF